MVRLKQIHRVYGRKYGPGDDVSHFPRHYLAILVRRGIAERVSVDAPSSANPSRVTDEKTVAPDQSWTVAQVRGWLSERGASTNGTKQELLERVNELHNGDTV